MIGRGNVEETVFMFLFSTISISPEFKRTRGASLLDLPGTQQAVVYMSSSGYQKELKGLPRAHFPTLSNTS